MVSNFAHFEHCLTCEHLMVHHKFPNLLSWMIHKPRGPCNKCDCREFKHSEKYHTELYLRCYPHLGDI